MKTLTFKSDELRGGMLRLSLINRPNRETMCKAEFIDRTTGEILNSKIFTLWSALYLRRFVHHNGNRYYANLSAEWLQSIFK